MKSKKWNNELIIIMLWLFFIIFKIITLSVFS